MSTVRLGPDGSVAERAAFPVGRLVVGAAELSFVSSMCGVPSPLLAMMSASHGHEALGERLGSEQPVPEAEDPEDVRARVGSQGLVDELGEVDPALAGALAVWQGAGLAVEFDLLVQHGPGRARVRSWHRNAGEHVVGASTADGEHVELAWMHVEDWWKEIARVAVLPVVPTRSAEPTETLPDVVETPWELLLGTGEAIASGRGELARQMVLDHTGLVGGGPRDSAVEGVDDEVALEWLGAFAHPALARLHAQVLSPGSGSPGAAGILEWVHHGDSWWALTPYVHEGWRMVRIERVAATDLPGRIAALGAEVLR